MKPSSIFAVSAVLSAAEAFYLPGVAPTSYSKGDEIPLLVNHITASEYGVTKGDMLSFDYYNPHFHYCQPQTLVKQPESIGSIIFGDRIFNSPFNIRMLENQECTPLCTAEYPPNDSKIMDELIQHGFFHNWLVDGLPAARKMHDSQTKTDFYGNGFDIGYYDDESRQAAIVNHFDIEIEYHQRGEDEFRVVGVVVNGVSTTTCGQYDDPAVLSTDRVTSVPFSYSVTFIASETVWATRWDKYLHVYDPNVQWFSLVNFSVVVILLSSVVVHSLTKALKADISRYNNLNLDDEMQEESGWKLIHGDIFRAPINTMLLTVFVGSGFQLFLMAFATIAFAMMGLLSPASRGTLPTVMFIFYALFGCVGSYVSMMLYKFFNGQNWKVNMILTPLLVPGSLFFIMIFLNFFLIFINSSGAIPFGTMLAIVAIWLLLSLPVSAIGSLVALKRESWTQPTVTTQIPRQIPQQPWYLKTKFAMVLGGMFPFGSIAVELYFIYNSLWYNKIFYMFGFLFFSFVLLTMTTTIVTILLTYYSLCEENWKWHWRSFFIAGGCSIYIFIHALTMTGFHFTGLVTIVMYLGYSFVVSILALLMTGSVGFLSSLYFIRRIYASIKVD